MDAVSEARLRQVCPALAAKTHTLAAMLEQDNVYIRVVQGMRTWAEQDTLYTQGRTAPGNIVTNVQGGYSYHNYGLAVDCVPSQFAPDKPYFPDWNSSHPVWKSMEAKGISLGLDSGVLWRTFPDAPHFQLTGPWPEGEPDDNLRQLFMDGGIQAVWQEVGLI